MGEKTPKYSLAYTIKPWPAIKLRSPQALQLGEAEFLVLKDLDTWLPQLGYGYESDAFHLLSSQATGLRETVLFLAPQECQAEMEVFTSLLQQALDVFQALPLTWSYYIDRDFKNLDADPKRGQATTTLGEVFGLNSLVLLVGILVTEHGIDDLSTIISGKGSVNWMNDPWDANAYHFPWPRFSPAEQCIDPQTGMNTSYAYHSNRVSLDLTTNTGRSINVNNPPYPHSVERYALG